jgi:alpha-N-arabinofuranosidase
VKNKKIKTLLAASSLFCAVGLCAAGQDPTPRSQTRIDATIDASQTADPISPYLYGMFIEHLGTLLNHGLWSEMLDDRKFFFPVTSSDDVDFPNDEKSQDVELRPLIVLKRWRPVGGDQFVVMDRDHPRVGGQSPEIRVATDSPHGIEQSGLGLRKGRAYIGRVVVSGTPGIELRVSLVWGDGTADRQTIVLPALKAKYATVPFSFAAKGDSDQGRLEIVGTGSGEFHIGAVSLMPADNVQGFRKDTIALIRNLNTGLWRLPGGNFLSDHDWRDAIGDPDKRPPTWDYAWHSMQPNDVGMDELMTLCKLIHVQPYITVNAGLEDDHSAADLVEYTNGSTQTRLGAMRAANGHAEPYHVKYWDVGNEPYGYWQIGHTAIQYYALKHNAFAKAMLKVDPTITILASGAMPDEITTTGNSARANGSLQEEYGTPEDWTGGLLARSWGHFDGLSEHWYANSGKRYDMNAAQNSRWRYGTEDGYVPVTEPLIDWARRPANRVRLKAEEWAEYQRRFPAMLQKKPFLAIDEWAYNGARPSLKTTLAYSMVLQEMFRHTDFLKIAAFTMGTSTLDITPTDATLNSTGLTFKLYRDHFGTLPVAVRGNSPQPLPKWPVGGDQPHVNAGSPTYPLDIVAALTPDRRCLTLAVVNATESEQTAALHVNGLTLAVPGRIWQITGASLDAEDKAGQPARVKIMETPLVGSASSISVAPISVTIYQFPVQ